MPQERGLGGLVNDLAAWLPEGLVVVDDTGLIVFANARAEQMFGYAPGELSGQPLEVLVPEAQRTGHQALRIDYGARPFVRPMTCNLDLHGRRKDGSQFPIEVDLGPMRGDDGQYVLAAVRDVSNRRRIEQQSRGELAQFQQLAATIPEVFWVGAPGGGELHYVSPAYERVWGRSCASLVADPWSWLEPVVADDRPALLEALKRHASGGDSVGTEVFPEFRITRPDGSVRWILVRALPVRGEDGAVVRGLGIAEDITERKRLEQLLEQARERLGQEAEQRAIEISRAQEHARAESAQRARVESWLWDIFESLPDAMIIVNSNGEVVGVNQTACVLFGYPRQELVGQSLDLLIPDVHRPSHQGRVAGYFHSPHARTMGSEIELEARRKDGTTVPVDISLSPFDTEMGRLVVAAVRDISDRRRAELALHESQERFDLAVRGSDAGIWDWDIRTSTVFFSDRWKSMLGYAPNEIAHEFTEWSNRLHPDDRARGLASIDAYLSGRTPEYELEHRLRHKDGTYRWILARGAAVRDAHGKFYRMVGSNIDITARKEAEEAVRRHETELIAAASIQRFLLPHESPHVPGLEIAGRCYPAEHTAGDYFDYLGFPDGTIAVMVADVTSHGLGPAIVAASCHSCIQSLSESLSDPSLILSRLNNRVYHETGGELLVSLVIARIDPVGRTLVCYNAGHPAVLVLDAGGRVKARLDAENLLVGVLPELTFDPNPEVALEPGDLVLLYTDGVTEAHPVGDATLFELDRTLGVVRAHLDRPASEIAEALHQAVCAHIGTPHLQDDVTVVVVKVGPPVEWAEAG